LHFRILKGFFFRFMHKTKVTKIVIGANLHLPGMFQVARMLVSVGSRKCQDSFNFDHLHYKLYLRFVVILPMYRPYHSNSFWSWWYFFSKFLRGIHASLFNASLLGIAGWGEGLFVLSSHLGSFVDPGYIYGYRYKYSVFICFKIF